MKLKKSFITYETDGEQVMVSTDNKRFSGLVRSNKTAAFIIDALKAETTTDIIIAAMQDKYDAPREVIAADVDAVIEKLRSIDAIQD